MHKNIVLIGMPGSGKTTLGKLISNRLCRELLSIDRYIEEKEGKTISDLFIPGEDHFRRIENKYVKEVSQYSNMVIDTGGGVIKNPINIHHLREKGTIIFINRPLDNIVGDIDVEHRPLLKDNKERLYKLYEERYDLYKNSCDYELINDDSIDVVIDKLISIIEEVNSDEDIYSSCKRKVV